MSNVGLSNAIIEKLARHGFFEKGLIEKARKIISESSNSRTLEDVLINELGFNRHAIYQEFCRLYGFREFRIDSNHVSEGWVQFIKKFYEKLEPSSQEKILKKKLLPFGFSEKNAEVVIFITPYPLDREIEGILLSAGIKKFEIAYGKLEDIDDILKRATPEEENEFLKELEEEEEIDVQEEEETGGIDEDELAQAISKSVIVNLFEGALVEGVRMGASDIHIIPDPNLATCIFFRVDGKLKLWNKKENMKPEAFFAVVKDRTKNVDRFEWDAAQDGFIQRMIDKYLIRFRVSILPIVSSQFSRKLESVVIRILDDRKVITDLEKLGLDDYAKKEFTKAIHKPQGMVILTGPTGSGKSTTLVAALAQVMTPEVNVLTVEDPVEYNIQGARQLKIGHKMNFEQAIRSILRHDPDIVMVGEIRDQQTAEVAIKLSNTGHLTFSTLHTNDAVSVVSRLFKMNIEPFLIAYAINLVVAQRLIRKLCPHCKAVNTELNPALAYALNMSNKEFTQATFYKPVGCDQCSRGYKGRMGIHEVLTFTNDIKNIILRSAGDLDEDALRTSAKKYGMRTLRETALFRAIQGVTSLDEVAAVTTE